MNIKITDRVRFQAKSVGKQLGYGIGIERGATFSYVVSKSDYDAGIRPDTPFLTIRFVGVRLFGMSLTLRIREKAAGAVAA